MPALLKKIVGSFQRMFASKPSPEVWEMPAHTAPTGKDEEFHVNLAGVRVLFADDNEDRHFILKESLQPVGVHLTCVYDGVEALDAVQGSGFDVILMDIDMPVLNGYQATQKLRTQGYNGAILAITGYIFPDELEKCRRAGFTDHLCKPFSPDMLYKALARHIRR